MRLGPESDIPRSQSLITDTAQRIFVKKGGKDLIGFERTRSLTCDC
jgi:hypothetical protein